MEFLLIFIIGMVTVRNSVENNLNKQTCIAIEKNR